MPIIINGVIWASMPAKNQWVSTGENPPHINLLSRGYLLGISYILVFFGLHGVSPQEKGKPPHTPYIDLYSRYQFRYIFPSKGLQQGRRQTARVKFTLLSNVRVVFCGPSSSSRNFFGPPNKGIALMPW